MVVVVWVVAMRIIVADSLSVPIFAKKTARSFYLFDDIIKQITRKGYSECQKENLNLTHWSKMREYQ